MQLGLELLVFVKEIISGRYFLQERCHLTGQDFEGLALVDMLFFDCWQRSLQMIKIFEYISNELFLYIRIKYKLFILSFKLLQLGFIDHGLLLWLSKVRLRLILKLGLRRIRVSLLVLSDSILSSLLLNIFQTLTANITGTHMIWIHQLFEFPLRKVLFDHSIIRYRPTLLAEPKSIYFGLCALELSSQNGLRTTILFAPDPL
jgi:hypothetical protein